ncbi:hypothetical protein IW140_006326 [Coemansia sp. RSA 1813]|nr:hypothetical protein EV178_006444 [Coemansia sp. RSA 1646]KAJ1765957.1 hypothetical protein LPJ74_006129 [Coemansia sp. RSA 1843]KAJ2085215.1 hypothetical protein IW138_006449 [Coemansia sp. RSA 986]KAJ2210239.1 hypothetical protein EV179_006373 [Coemansia sp. RSA 487]KAJ2562791.1 hypothetical protein IW140_006326 [Coemansia sp. RSA 1813]
MVRDEILPLVLSRIVDSINEKDYDQMNELMTPYLAKLYKNAIDDLDAQGYSMRLEIDVRESSPKNDYELAKYGDPDAYDYTIPYADRNFRYSMNRMGARLAIASRRNLHNKSAFRGPMRESGANAFNQWLAFEFGFIVDADVKVDLYKNNCIIDSDSGMMKIPIAISTPHLLGINGMAEAVSAGEKAEAEKPFEWRVCDLFYIADRNNANEIEKAKANEDTNK